MAVISWVTPLPRRQPWYLARNPGILDRFSNGHVMLGTELEPAFD